MIQINRQYNFCTVVTKYYLVKALALHHSLAMHADKFKLFICCMDKTAYSILKKQKLKNAIIMNVSEVEDAELVAVKGSRSMSEYCYTLKAPLVLHLFEKYQNLDSMIYIDGDLFFFSSPEAIYEEWGQNSIFICPQRTHSQIEANDGKFQAGLIGFKKDNDAFECLYWWRDKCIEWCSREWEDDRWTDQKYIDHWPHLFSGVHVTKNLGVNAAWWNIGDYKFYKKNGSAYINDNKLVIYHFAYFTIFNHFEFSMCTIDWKHISEEEKKIIFIPYMKVIRNMVLKIKKIDKKFSYGFSDKSKFKPIHNYLRYTSRN